MLIPSTLAVPLVLLDGRIGRTEAGALLLCALVYTWWMVRKTKATTAGEATVVMEAAAESAGAPSGTGRGRMFLIGGGRLFVDAAVLLAREAGLSDRVVRA